MVKETIFLETSFFLKKNTIFGFLEKEKDFGNNMVKVFWKTFCFEKHVSF